MAAVEGAESLCTAGGLVCKRPHLPLLPQSNVMWSRHKALFSAETLTAQRKKPNIRAACSLVLMQGLERWKAKITGKGFGSVVYLYALQDSEAAIAILQYFCVTTSLQLSQTDQMVLLTPALIL